MISFQATITTTTPAIIIRVPIMKQYSFFFYHLIKHFHDLWIIDNTGTNKYDKLCNKKRLNWNKQNNGI